MRYEIEPKNRFVEAIRGIAEHEIRPGNTVTFLSEINLTAVEAIRRRSQPRPSYTAFVVKAVAMAMREYPYANRRLCRRLWWPFSPRMQRFHACDVSVADERDVPGAESTTFVDVCREADAKSLAEITAWLHGLATCDLQTNAQWRTFWQTITRVPACIARHLIRLPLYFPSLWVKYRGGAAMVSSPAKYGVDALVATWTAPLGVSFGLVKERPIVENGRVVAAPTMTLTLNFDRRVMAGAQAARFFHRFVELLEHADVELVGGAAASSDGESPRAAVA